MRKKKCCIIFTIFLDFSFPVTSKSGEKEEHRVDGKGVRGRGDPEACKPKTHRCQSLIFPWRGSRQDLKVEIALPTTSNIKSNLFRMLTEQNKPTIETLPAFSLPGQEI